MKRFICAFLILATAINFCFAFDLPWQEKNAKEFINIETSFVFSDLKKGNERSIVYGSTSGRNNREYFIPEFEKDDEALLFVELNPTLLPNIAKNVRESEKAPTREIIVEVTFQKSKDIIVKQDGGIKSISNREEADGTHRFIFEIKNNSEMYRQLRFSFVPSDVGDAIISVVYYAKDPQGLKIVDRTCDVFQTVRFKCDELSF